MDCAVRLHMEIGPGLLETVYEVLLAHMLREAGLRVERQVPIPIESHTASGSTRDSGLILYMLNNSLWLCAFV